MSYLATPEYGPRNPVTCVPGWPTLTTCKLLVATIHNPSTPVVVTVNGVDYTGVVGSPGVNQFQLIARGTDHPNAGTTGPAQACWTGLLLVTGLSPWTRYPWSVVQGANSDSGSLKSAPRKSDAHRVEGAGCDNNTRLSSGSFDDYLFTVPGYWQHMKRRAEADDKTSGVLFIDDLGYVDNCRVHDIYWDDASQLELSVGFAGGEWNGSPQTSLLEYDYALAYCCMLGLLGPVEFTSADWDAAVAWPEPDEDRVNRRIIAWGREVNRAWCRKNLNVFPQFGDHEFINDIGWDIPVTTYPNARYTSLGVNGPGWTMWHAFYGALQPDPISGAADAAANHWCAELGCLTIATFDAVTNSDITGDQTYNPPSEITTLFGADQIEDVLGEIQRLQNPYTLIGLQHSVRYLWDGVATLTEFGYGAQHPLYDHVLPEYQRLFTAIGQTPQSLMDSRWTNGVGGVLTLMHADNHRGQCIHWRKAAYEGNRAENFYSIQFGTTNGSVHHTSQQVSENNTLIADGLVEYTQTSREDVSNRQFHGAQVVVSPDVCAARIGDMDDATMWAKNFYPGRGNSGFVVDQPPAFASIAVGDGLE